jgi:hypothetical protein
MLGVSPKLAGTVLLSIPQEKLRLCQTMLLVRVGSAYSFLYGNAAGLLPMVP